MKVKVKGGSGEVAVNVTLLLTTRKRLLHADPPFDVKIYGRDRQKMAMHLSSE